MVKIYRYLKLHFNQLSLRERGSIAVACAFLIYAIWFIGLNWSLSRKIKNEITQIAMHQREIQVYQTQLADTEKRIKENTSSELSDQHQKLKNDILILDKKYEFVIDKVINQKEFSNSIKVMLSKAEGMKFISFSSLPAVLLKEPHVSLGTLTKGQKLFKLGIELHYEGTYFNTLSYLKNVENLGLPFFWDELDYKVGQYPNANIVLRLYAVSEEEGLVNAK